jgi:hypothetical protein
MCFVTTLAREHARLNDIFASRMGTDEEGSFEQDETAAAMTALRVAATFVPETAEGWAFQGETLADGLDDGWRYNRLLAMVRDHLRALAAPAEQAAA